jgi:hypothetical protein
MTAATAMKTRRNPRRRVASGRWRAGRGADRIILSGDSPDMVLLGL